MNMSIDCDDDIHVSVSFVPVMNFVIIFVVAVLRFCMCCIDRFFFFAIFFDMSIILCFSTENQYTFCTASNSHSMKRTCIYQVLIRKNNDSLRWFVTWLRKEFNSFQAIFLNKEKVIEKQNAIKNEEKLLKFLIYWKVLHIINTLSFSVFCSLLFLACHSLFFKRKCRLTAILLI